MAQCPAILHQAIWGSGLYFLVLWWMLYTKKIWPLVEWRTVPFVRLCTQIHIFTFKYIYCITHNLSLQYIDIWTYYTRSVQDIIQKFTERHLKGQCHEIFDFCFFSWISFPQAPEYTIRAISNFFGNSRRYSQLKVHHGCHWKRWQMEKIFNQKSFNFLFVHLWEVELTYRYIFAFKLTLRL